MRLGRSSNWARMQSSNVRKHTNILTGKYSVPVLWDKKEKTIVNNEVREAGRRAWCELHCVSSVQWAGCTPHQLL